MSASQLTGAKATMLATLYGRALDAGSPDPILNDQMALDAVRRLDFDFGRTGLRRGDEKGVSLRVRQFDRWAGDFLAAHPEATVLHLGCGLDTRVYRLDPGPGVRWFDVDFPEVIELRHELFPERDNYRTISSSVTDLAWLEQIPADRPTLVIAEGVTMYLTEDTGRPLFQRIAQRFPSGELMFDAFSRAGLRFQWMNGVVRAAGATLYWAIPDAAYLEAIDPRLRRITTMSAMDLDDLERMGLAYRLLLPVLRRVPGLRTMAALYRLGF